MATSTQAQHVYRLFSRCGESPLATDTDNYGLLSRIVGGTVAKKLTHPWIVSLKRDAKHFCGGTIISNKYVITAAHCVSDRNVEATVIVCIGDHDFSVDESTERFFHIKKVTKHPNFNPSQPINYDIAVLELARSIKFDEKIQPACLPNPDDIFAAGSLCVALGWGRLQENGQLPTRLQQVALPLVEYKRCLHAMETLDGRLVFDTVVCAGFPEGGKDACQGDSGGPFLCQRSHGRWVLVGVTSWGMGCARKWDNNLMQVPGKRGSPAVFTDIQRLLHWVTTNLKYEQPTLTPYQVHCSVNSGFLRGTAGQIILPAAPQKYYLNNENCRWMIIVPQGKHILLTFTRFNLEWDYSCDLDYLAIYSKEIHLIGKFCGNVPPRPILVSNSDISLKFISDFQEYRTGFALSYLAVEPNFYPDSACGSVAVIFEEGEIQSMNHPQKYTRNANCHWVVYSPKTHTIKITFLVFEVEPSNGCIFDRVVVYHNVAGTVVAGKFCGFALPAPVLSTSNVMQIKFTSDTAGNYIGFRAVISFVPISTSIRKKTLGRGYSRPRNTQAAMETYDKVCGAAPVPPRFIHRSISEAEEAIPNSWPWQVSINCGGTHVCSGAIISERFVLTSASCVTERNEIHDVCFVIAGLHDLERSENSQKRLVKQVIVHPEFSPLLMDFDIALIQLEEGYRFSPYIQPICLPEAHSMVEPSTLCVVSGWDLKRDEEKSKKLQQLEVAVLPDDICNDYYPNFITERMFCAGTATSKSSVTCPGQPGAPLVCLSDDPGIYFIFGIVSWGVGCKENPKPGVYTNVSVFVEWIDEIVLADSTSPNEPGSTQDSYVTCKEDVMFLQSPGELKLVVSSQHKGFRCQLKIQAPKDHFIIIHFKHLHGSYAHNSLVIYEGASSNGTVKAELTKDEIPITITSVGPSLIIEATKADAPSELRVWFTYTFHSQH
ncbi:ovochymase-2-like isoform X2 [Pseudophryne corroboree]|uniref:ovochymase-2-like isoform X2 n=1 Tax=Pseudophryne corroboree TaxID=495146 RepID=UPI003081B9AB